MHSYRYQLGFEPHAYLDMACLPGAVHSTCHVDRVTPNIIVRFPSTDYSGQQWSFVQTLKKDKKVKTQIFKTPLTIIRTKAMIKTFFFIALLVMRRQKVDVSLIYYMMTHHSKDCLS